MNKTSVTSSVEQWLDSVVVGLNLCPFARVPLVKGTVHFSVSSSTTQERLLEDLATELQRLDQNPQIETTLLIHPTVLGNFDDYNQFLSLAELMLVDLGYEGVYQIASFHPDYQFEGTAVNEAQNYSNRSPYPILHLLREDSVEAVTISHTDTEAIPVRNIEVLTKLGRVKLEKLLSECMQETRE